MAGRVAAALLLIMPLVRALSYSLAGVYAITDLDGDGGLDGSPVEERLGGTIATFMTATIAGVLTYLG